jgi:CspA family cold shock protein
MRTGSMPKQCGTVKWFHPNKHYGFITTEESGDIFFHERQIVKGREKEAFEGQIARFHLRSTGKGPEALNVELDGAE